MQGRNVDEASVQNIDSMVYGGYTHSGGTTALGKCGIDSTA